MTAHGLTPAQLRARIGVDIPPETADRIVWEWLSAWPRVSDYIKKLKEGEA